MMLQDAKAEIMRKISSVCGYEVKEEDLSPTVRESIVSMAQTYKQLTVIRELLLVERKDAMRPSARLKRAITGEQDKQLSTYLDQLNELHKMLENQIQNVTKEVVEELKSRFSPGTSPATTGSHFVIQQLKCSNCGAELKLSSDHTMKCEYCGASYALSDYLDRMGDMIQGRKPDAPVQDSAEGGQKQDEVRSDGSVKSPDATPASESDK